MKSATLLLLPISIISIDAFFFRLFFFLLLLLLLQRVQRSIGTPYLSKLICAKSAKSSSVSVCKNRSELAPSESTLAERGRGNQYGWSDRELLLSLHRNFSGIFANSCQLWPRGFRMSLAAMMRDFFFFQFIFFLSFFWGG